MGYIKNFIKKYAALLPPISLLILAVILFLPTMWLGGRVKAHMENSAAQSRTIRSLMTDVPSRDMPTRVNAYMEQLESEVQLIDDVVRQSSQRELVAWNIFPEPTDTSSQIFVEFGKNFRRTIEQTLENMNALDAPTESEIRQWVPTRAAGADEMYSLPAAARRVTAQNPMIDALCIRRAESISVYAGPSAFAWYDFWQNFQFEGREAAIKDCWYSQVALWIYEDVVKTVQAMNFGSDKVSTSPVKRLLGVSFSEPVQVEGRRQSEVYGRGAGVRQTAAGRDNPNYVTAAMPSLLTQQAPWTGRIGGADYDVIHFAVSVIIDSRHVLGFMRELCSEKEHRFREDFKEDGRIIESKHNQITILQNAVHTIDMDSPLHELYRYGNGAIMRLDLVCEYLLSREGYDGIKPDPIKKEIGQMDVQTQMPGMPGSMPGGFGMQ